MIRVQMQIPERMDERARFQTADLRHHQCEQSVRGNVEGDTQKKIGAALIKLATQLTILQEKLKQRMTWRQGHPAQFANVPGAHDEAPAIGFVFDIRNDLINLVDRAAIGSSPIRPL